MLILASGSAARQSMLRAAGVDFCVVPAAIDEAALFAQYPLAQYPPGARGAQVAEALAAAKALAVSRDHAGCPVLGADSVVELETGELWQKPQSLAELRAQLGRLRGRPHDLHSVAVGVRDGEIIWTAAASARLFVRDFTDDWLDGYIRACGTDMLASVGGYHIEALGGQLFSHVEGDQFVVRGLPLFAVLAWLREIGELQT